MTTPSKLLFTAFAAALVATGFLLWRDDRPAADAPIVVPPREAHDSGAQDGVGPSPSTRGPVVADRVRRDAEAPSEPAPPQPARSRAAQPAEAPDASRAAARAVLKTSAADRTRRYRVTAPDGVPVPGAVVILYGAAKTGAPPPILVTDAEGMASAEPKPGPYTVVARSPHGSIETRVGGRNGNDDPLELRLAPFAYADVRVLDADGAPVEGARVGAPRAWTSLEEPPVLRSATDADGRVRVELPAFERGR
ncbi:MAG TPA: hypothetical protein VEI02_16875, partial [Planctomycetota bacterium]|nr:hypothetical protein [Planctomycetota bacterium]